MKKKLILVSLTVFLVSAVSGSSFGTISSENSKTVSGNNASFYVDVMNLGSQPLDVQVEAFNVDSDVSMRFEMPEDSESSFDSFILEPSTVTGQPGNGDRWFLLEENKYVETSRIGIKGIRTGENKNADFDIRVTASTFSDTDDSSSNVKPSQTVVQVREYSFSMTASESADSGTIDSDDTTQSQGGENIIDGARGVGSNIRQNIEDGINSFTSGSGSSTGSSAQSSSQTGSSSGKEDDPEVNVGQGSEQDTSSNNQESSGDTDRPQVERESSTQDRNKSSQSSQNQSITGNFAEQVNTMTYVLVLVLVLSTVYLLKVM